jgi:peptidoglycan/xylan/chitin deacetylase (PgdA/CDA1 family)
MIIAIILIIAFVLFIIGYGAYHIFMWPRSKFFGYYPYGIKTDKKILALSFDDGPTNPDTKNLLAVLARHDVKATFFLVGKNLEKNPELVKELLAAGHTLGNHAYNHRLQRYLVTPDLKDEVEKTQNIIYGLIGKKPTLFRSPWLIRHPSLFKMAKAHGLTLIGGIFGTQKEVWEVSADEIYNDALKQIAPGRIMIFHDGIIKKGSRAGTIEAVDRLIPELKRQGYEFVTVDQLLNIPAYQ